MPVSVNINVHIPVSNMEDLRKALDSLKDYDLLVGVPADDERKSSDGKTARTVDAQYAAQTATIRGKKVTIKGRKHKATQAVNNATLAYIHNNGSPAQNIPARPTLIPGVEDAKDKIAKRFEDAGKAALDGSLDRVEKNFEAAGIAAQNAVRARIRSNTPPPLSPRTIAARKRRGHNSERTLVETGQYLNAHTYVVRKKK